MPKALAPGAIAGDGPRAAEAPGAADGGYPRVVPRRVLAIVATLAVALSFALPGIAARYVDAAYARSPQNPALAVARLRRAAQLNFLSADPLLAEGIIARRLGDSRASEDALRRALQREPRNWFAYFELALVQGISGAPVAARSNLEHARALNPGQAVIGVVAGQLARGERIDPDALEAQLSSQLQRRLSPTG